MINTFLKALGLDEDWNNTVKENIHGEIIPDYITLKSGEDFRFIKEFPRYIVTNYGRIINILTGRVIKQTFHKTAKANTIYGIYDVCLRNKQGKAKTIAVHRLVAEAFCTKPDNLKDPVVNHIDHNTANNMASNLEWVERSKNSTGRKAKLPNTIEELIALRKTYKAGSNEYNSISAKIYKVRRGL